MKTITKRSKLACAALIVSTGALAPSVANAVGRHQSAMACQRSYNDSASSLFLHDHGQVSANPFGYFLCPVMNDSFINVRNPTGTLPVDVKVSGYSNGNNASEPAIQLFACHTSAVSNGGECGSPSTVTTAGVFQDRRLTDLSAWSSSVTSDSDAFFILASLNSSLNGGYNVIWSYNVTQ